MNRTAKLFAAFAFAAGSLLSATAARAESYPRIVGSGENASVEYGPGPAANIVGGGHALVTGSGESVSIQYLDAQFVQRPRNTLVPVAIGSGENISIAWVPAGSAS